MKPPSLTDADLDNDIDKPSEAVIEDSHLHHEHNARLTRSILFKTDTRVLPILALLFLCSFLDRTNVGNAKIIGLAEDLEISNLQYNQGLAVFYATYIASPSAELTTETLTVEIHHVAHHFTAQHQYHIPKHPADHAPHHSELPSNLILKRLTPRVWLASLACAWGTVTMCLGFVRNYGSFVAVRAILGATEGGLLPGMVLYLSGLYTRGEMALRIGIFYTAASLSGAFGGLLARGLSAIGPRGGLEGWRWIFIIEGLLTVVCGAISYFFLASNLHTASFLTPEEREFAAKRLSGEVSNGERFSVNYEREEKFRWSEVKRGVFNIQVWLTATAYFAILSGLYSFGLFLPTIINDMKITSDANQTQLWSVIPYAVATPVTVFIAFLSDRLKLRGTIMLFTLPIAIAGYAVIANVTSAHARFAMTCLMAIGMYASVPCVLVWNSNNSAGHYKRATTSALQLAIANAGGFVATFIYPKDQGPLYHEGHSVILGLLCYAWVAVLANVLYCRKVNRDKQAGKYAQFEGSGDDRDPRFVMIL